MGQSQPIPLVQVITEYAEQEWGFTGTRAGMSAFQLSMVRRVLSRGQPTYFRHGGAYGADTDAHKAWKKLCPKSHANVWPADEKRAAIFQGDARTTVEAVMDPLDRNVCIVQSSKFVLATPHTEHEVQRSGTWHAIRKAFKRNVPVLIIWPKSQKLTLYCDKALHRVSYITRDESITK